VLFLGASGPSIPYVLGLSQGVFRVIEDPQTNARLVVPPPVVAGVDRPARAARGQRPAVRCRSTRFADEVRALRVGRDAMIRRRPSGLVAVVLMLAVVLGARPQAY